MIFQISSGSGPAECELAVAHFWRALNREFPGLRLLEKRQGSVADGLCSVRFEAGEATQALGALTGTVQWICRSPLRPKHPRKNWFIALSAVPEVRAPSGAGPVRFEHFRSTGRGGQNVNKVETGVRLIHESTGIAVRADGERSQQQNRRTAQKRLAGVFEKLRDEAKGRTEANAWRAAKRLVRGNAVRVYVGPAFKLKQ